MHYALHYTPHHCTYSPLYLRQQPGTFKDNYKLGKKLGSGAFSDVLQATSRSGDKVVMAAKRVKKSRVAKPNDIVALKREVRK